MKKPIPNPNEYSLKPGYRRMLENAEALKNKSGWMYERWLKLSLASLPRQQQYYEKELERLSSEKENKGD